ncbi:MAG TPA: triose-phosphate isomerase [Pseudogracilibacillus sp.]|nr:triose-phosphate isomerase [Pseudogracilibacillus sp.]
MSQKIKTPFFVINPKNFLYGKNLLTLAVKANSLAQKYGVDTFFTSPPTELINIVKKCPNLKVTAQHMDENTLGNTMGRILAEPLAECGVQAVVLNHAEHQLTISKLKESIHQAKEFKLKTIVCADSIKEAQMVAMLEPDIVLAEPSELIGQPQTSSKNYVQSTIEAIQSINPNILVEQGAGIRTENDVRELLYLGADGVGVTSGIIKAQDPQMMMEKMIKEVAKFSKGGK